jgi:hypothetical protein
MQQEHDPFINTAIDRGEEARNPNPKLFQQFSACADVYLDNICKPDNEPRG